jgi:hypothetical protein
MSLYNIQSLLTLTGRKFYYELNSPIYKVSFNLIFKTFFFLNTYLNIFKSDKFKGRCHIKTSCLPCLERYACAADVTRRETAEFEQEKALE